MAVDQGDAQLLGDALDDLRDGLATWARNGGDVMPALAHTLDAIVSSDPAIARRLQEAVNKRTWRSVRGKALADHAAGG